MSLKIVEKAGWVGVMVERFQRRIVNTQQPTIVAQNMGFAAGPVAQLQNPPQKGKGVNLLFSVHLDTY